MGVFDGYRINKSIAILLSSRNATDPETSQASAKLKSIGKVAIPKLLEALAKTQTPDLLLDVLMALLEEATLPLYIAALRRHDPRIASGVAAVLIQSKTYDPNQLLSLFADPKIPKVTLAKILAVHLQALEAKDSLSGSRNLVQLLPGERRHTLQPKKLLEMLDIVSHDDCQVLLRCIDQVTTTDLLPELVRRLPKAGELVRLYLTRTLARFQEETVRVTLLELLHDPYAPVRCAALEGLYGMLDRIDIAPICRLLRDTDRSMQRLAIQFLIQRRDLQVLPYLVELLQDPAADVCQNAIDVLAVVGTPEAFQAAIRAQGDSAALRDMLLFLLMDAHVSVRLMALEGLQAFMIDMEVDPLCQLLRDRDMQVRSKAIALLTQRKDPKMFQHLLHNLQDEADAVRQGAVEVLNAVSSPSALRELLGALRDSDVWIKTRVIEALGKGANTALINTVLTLVKDEDQFIRHQAMDILQQKQDEGTAQVLLNTLQTGDTWGKECAAEALAALGDKRVVPALVRLLQENDASVSSMAIRTLAALQDPQAIDPLLAYVKKGEGPAREEALRALATLTDAAHAGTVLQAVMAARATTDKSTRETANTTASMVIRRFGDNAVFTSTAGVVKPAVLKPAMGQPTAAVYHVSTDGTEIDMLPAMHEVYGDAPSLEHGDAPSDYRVTTDSNIDVNGIKPGMLLAQRYRIIRQVGRGGFGTVFLVEDTKVNEEIILKFLNAHIAADESMVGRFIHELRYARRVTHENVIRIHDLLTLGDVCAISMEYFPSHSLSEELKDRRPLAFQHGLKIILDVCCGMIVAHQAKVIHRDLKPPNILINDEGLVKIVDFGLAAAASGMDTRLTATGAVLGTPAYMAPEQVRSGIIDARTDIYSLGIIMYELFTGAPPYLGGNALSVLFQHVEGKPIPPREKNPNISPELEAVILRAMAVAPDERFQTMQELRERLSLFTQ